MKIIDFKKKGQSVRFFLGRDDLDSWYGDDWNDTPYEHNAGQVYDEFVERTVDIVFPFDDLVLEPSDGTMNSDWCKDDMVGRRVPCVIHVPAADADQSWDDSFRYWVGSASAEKYYFGDKWPDDKL